MAAAPHVCANVPCSIEVSSGHADQSAAARGSELSQTALPEPPLAQRSFGVTQPAHSRYQILEKIASGSFATVYRGRDLELGRDVAIKQIHDHYLDNPKQLERYWHEARILAEHHHPNIVTIYDIVRERGWLILELMQGSLLKVAGRKALDVESVRGTLAHCLRALKFLHAHGIVHGDIKPSNMMIDRRKRIKIGDFGLARRVSDDEGSLVKGTTKYMAPEVVSEDFGEVGPASDLYSLGFAAFELLCGENFESLFPGLSAFGRDKQIAWMMWHAAPDRKLPDISRVLEGVPDDLARCIQRLVAKPLSERYRNADQALADLHMDKVGKGESSQDESYSMPPAKDAQVDRRRWLIIGAFSFSVLMSVMVLMWDSLTGSGNATPEAGISGIVREVNSKDNSLTLEDETGYPNIVPIEPQTRFLLVDDKTQVFLKDLKPGDRVETPKGKKNRKLVLDVFRPKRARGRLDSVDLPRNELTLLIEEGANREQITLRVPERTAPLLNGKKATLLQLNKDDRIDAVHILDSSQKATRVAIELQALRTTKLLGFVVKGDAKRLTVEQRGETAKTQTELPFAEGCEITVNGQKTADGKPLTPRDIIKGDRVIVQHDTHITAVQVSRRQMQSGMVVELDEAKRTIALQTEKGEKFQFIVPEDSEISLGGEHVALGELRRYDKADISFDPEAGTPAARTIDGVRQPRKDRLVILFGVQSFTDRNLSRLDTPVADVKQLHDMLVKRYCVAPTDILTLADATKAEIENEIPAWLKRSSNLAQVVIYVASQGYKDEDGSIYLAAKDTQFAELSKTGVSLDWLAKELDGSVARERILLLDACHAGSGPDLRKQPSGAEMVESVATGDKRSLKATYAIAGSSRGQVGLITVDKQHSLFASSLAEAFSGKADVNGNLILEPKELLDFLVGEMKRGSEAQQLSQTPQMFAPQP